MLSPCKLVSKWKSQIKSSISFRNSREPETLALQPILEVGLHLFSIGSISDIHSWNYLVRPQKLYEDKDKFTRKGEQNNAIL